MLARKLVPILFALVVLAGCGSESGTASDNSPTTEALAAPETAQDLLGRAIEWVESEPKRADAGGPTPQASPYWTYGEGGLPLLLHVETPGHPFPGPLLFDGETYYLQVVKEGHELEGQWISIPAQLLESEEGRRELGDLADSITWFWIFDPLTALRASIAAGDLGPMDAEGVWTIRATLTSDLLAQAIPGEWQEEEFDIVEGGTIELEATADGAIRSMTVNNQLDAPTAFPWSWSSEEEGPKVPENALPFEEVKDSLR
jgi:hypothetical protein